MFEGFGCRKFEVYKPLRKRREGSEFHGEHAALVMAVDKGLEHSQAGAFLLGHRRDLCTWEKAVTST